MKLNNSWCFFINTEICVAIQRYDWGNSELIMLFLPNRRNLRRFVPSSPNINPFLDKRSKTCNIAMALGFTFFLTYHSIHGSFFSFFKQLYNGLVSFLKKKLSRPRDKEVQSHVFDHLNINTTGCTETIPNPFSGLAGSKDKYFSQQSYPLRLFPPKGKLMFWTCPVPNRLGPYQKEIRNFSYDLNYVIVHWYSQCKNGMKLHGEEILHFFSLHVRSCSCLFQPFTMVNYQFVWDKVINWPYLMSGIVTTKSLYVQDQSQ